MRKLLFGVVALAVLFAAAPAKATSLDFCLAGCKAAPAKAVNLSTLPLKADPTPAPVPGPEQKVLPMLYLAPSVGFDAFVRDNSSNEWKAGVIPGVGYGIKWRPSSYTLTQNLLALDVFMQAAMASDRFDIDLLPVLTVFDWVGVGFGYRWQLATTAGVSDKGGTLFSIGIHKSLASF
jgi:hypothetical protein